VLPLPVLLPLLLVLPPLLLVPLPLLLVPLPLLLLVAPLVPPLVLPLPVPELLPELPPELLPPLLLVPLPEPASGLAVPDQEVLCEPSAQAATSAHTPTQNDTVPKPCIHHLRQKLVSEHRASNRPRRLPPKNLGNRRCTTPAP
jgi:hypothetical protein